MAAKAMGCLKKIPWPLAHRQVVEGSAKKCNYASVLVPEPPHRITPPITNTSISISLCILSKVFMPLLDSIRSQRDEVA